MQKTTRRNRKDAFAIWKKERKKNQSLRSGKHEEGKMPKSTINWMHNIIRTMQAFSAEFENDTKPKKLFATYLIFCARLFIFALHWFRPSSLNAATSKMMHEKYIKHEEAQQKLAHTENQMEKLPSNLSRTINIYFFPVVFSFFLLCMCCCCCCYCCCCYYCW